jgi:hypothetical protein
MIFSNFVLKRSEHKAWQSRQLSMNRLRVDRPRNRGSITGMDNKYFLFQSSRLVIASTQLRVQWVQWAYIITSLFLFSEREEQYSEQT